MIKHWPTSVDINLANIEHNVSVIKNRIGNDVCLMAVVKAEAYGHGSYETSMAAIKGGAEKLGVASSDDGIELRNKGITVPILILGLSFENSVEDIIKYDLMQTVCSIDLVDKLSKEASNQNKIAKINIKVNTGMNRIGIEPEDVIEFVRNVQGYPNIFIEGIFTHLATSYEKNEYVNYQFERFLSVLKNLEKSNINIPYKHCCNTGGILNFPHMYLNQVRAGVIITTPFPAIEGSMNLDLKESLELKSKIVYIRNLKKGQSIGYNRMYFAEEDSTIAVVSAGWGDGIPRELTNKGYVLIHGVRCHLRGRVCCDQIFADITGISDVNIGDEVVVVGKQKEEFISSWEWGKLLGGVSSPITLRSFITQRVQRNYIR